VAEKKYWRATELGVAIEQTWGYPLRLTLETERTLGFVKKQTLFMAQTDALRLAERIYSALGCSGMTSPNWRTRYPDEFPGFKPHIET